ncbi:MAG: hypothetical protein KY455_06195 [Euryarchaeota archaeon]|nr:hypothetical protein [Euryarchaeota archaeon]
MSRYRAERSSDQGDRAPDFPDHLEKDVKGEPPFTPSRTRSPGLARMLSSGGREPKGDGVSVKRTCKTGPEAIYGLFKEKARRTDWLAQVADSMGSETFHRLAEEDWETKEDDKPTRLAFHVRAVGGDSGSDIRVRIQAKKDDTCHVVVTHEELTSRAEQVAMNRCWSEALDRLTVRFGEG